MPNCSNEYPNTDVFYSEISGDYLSLVLLGLGSVLVLVSVGLFVEELIFLQQVYFQDEVKVRKIATILGVFPVTVITAFLAVVVPTSTFLVDLIQTCYLSVCFYTFVTLAIDYFGGDQGLLDHLGATKVRTALPPCCCCLCCILRPRILTRNSLLVFKLMSLQVAVLRPVLLFIAAVMWTDGKYKRGLDSASSAYIYITAVTSISLLFSMYGSGVIYRAVAPCLTSYRITAKFVSIKLLLIVSNIQTLVFSILAANDQPPCLGSRGPIVRGSALNHFCLLIEASALCLLARRGYRMDERELPPPDKLSGDADNDEDAVNSDKAWFDNIAVMPDSAI